jgi:hypothetical protein
MKLPRFSIASILAVIAFVAVALAALRTPSNLWANVTSSLAMAALVGAIINVIYARGTVRAYWLGFSLCGGIYFSVCLVPGLRDSICPRLVTEVVLDLLYPHISAPTAPSPVLSIGYTTTVPLTGSVPTSLQGVSAVNGSSVFVYSNSTTVTLPQLPTSQWAAWTEPDRRVGVGFPIGTVLLCSSEAFRRIGHSLFTLVAAVMGGTFARHRYRISMPGRTKPDSGTS